MEGKGERERERKGSEREEQYKMARKSGREIWKDR